MCSTLRYLNTWSQPYCWIGSTCPPSEATNVVMNDRVSHGVVTQDGSGRDSVTHMKSGVMAADMTV